MGAMKDKTIGTPEKQLKPIDVIKDQLEKRKEDFAGMLPIPMKIDHFLWTAYLAILKQPELLNCTKQSLFTAIGNAAEVGLDFTPAKRHAYLVPYKGEATFMPGYGGLIEVALRSGKVIKIESRLVYSEEEFEMEYGTQPYIRHIPKQENRGDVIGAYAIAWMTGGLPIFEFMSKSELDTIKGYAKTQKIWGEHESEMQRKSVVRRLYKYLPSTPEMAKVEQYDNNMFNMNTSVASGEHKSRADSIMDSLTGNGNSVTDIETQDVPKESTSETKIDTILETKKDPTTLEILDDVFGKPNKKK